MPVNNAVQGIDYMNRKQVNRIARNYGLYTTPQETKIALVARIKAK